MRWRQTLPLLLLLGSGALYGCGTLAGTTNAHISVSSQRTSQYLPSKKDSVSTENTGYTLTSPRDKPLISGPWAVQGIIAHVDKTPVALHTITLKVTKPVTGAAGTAPFKPGQVLTIYFDENLSHRGHIDPKTGDKIQITVGQYLAVSASTARAEKKIWGSNFTWYLYEKNGVFYDDKGRKFPYAH